MDMLAMTPPMGWNTWNTFGKQINEKVIFETADAMVRTGLRDAGYEYLVIDDAWQAPERGADGRLRADPEKFPNGMKAVADYVHGKGLKFGIYSCAGNVTCMGLPGSFDHEFDDARTFAEYGADFLKYDFCFVPQHVHGPLLYRRMGLALKATGREILFSACNWGYDGVETWARSAGAHMYRSTGDISDNFRSMADIARSQLGKLPYSGPGCFNDVDMLVCGMHNAGNVAMGGMTDPEYLFHFALWCVLGSPLMVGCDVRAMDEATLRTLTNGELLRISQDAEARPLYRITGNHADERMRDGTLFGFRHLAGGEFLLAAFNFTDKPLSLWDGSVYFHDIGLPAASGYGLRMTDVMTGGDLGVKAEFFTIPLGGHDFRLYRCALAPL